MKKRKLRKLIRRIQIERLTRKDWWLVQVADAINKHGGVVPLN